MPREGAAAAKVAELMASPEAINEVAYEVARWDGGHEDW
jgi:hypothetical protein